MDAAVRRVGGRREAGQVCDGHRRGGRNTLPSRHFGLIAPIRVAADPYPGPAAPVGRDQTPAGVVVPKAGAEPETEHASWCRATEDEVDPFAEEQG